MKREEMNDQSNPFDDDSPATKPPNNFAGIGLEIIGEPNKISGELWYRDGRFYLLSSASPAFEDLPPSKRPRISVGKQAAWFSLERKFKLANPQSDVDPASRQREEFEATDRAATLARAFADAMLKGQLMPLIREVEDEYSREAKRAQARRNRKSPEDGILDALTEVARRSTHPDQVTVSAIVDFLRAANEFCKRYGITESMKSPREVRKRLDWIGFSWIGEGRKRGRPRNP